MGDWGKVDLSGVLWHDDGTYLEVNAYFGSPFLFYH